MLKFTKYGKKGAAGKSASNNLTCSTTSETGSSGTLPKERLPLGCGNDATTCIIDSTKRTEGFAENQVPENASTTTTSVIPSGSLSLLSQQEQTLLNKDSLDSSLNVMKPLNSYQSHLKLSKVPKDELLKMDAEMKLEYSSKTLGKRSRSIPKGTDDNRSNVKVSRPSMVTLKNALDLESSIKVPVFNDGYFPKIQPLNKLFFMKRAK